MRVVTLFACWIGNLEILHCESGHRVHRDFKVHLHRADLLSGLRSIVALQVYFCVYDMFLTSLQFFNGPGGKLLRLVVFVFLATDSFGNLKVNCRSVFRYGELDNYLGCKMILGEVRSHFDSELNFTVVDFLDEGIYPEGSGVLRVNSIVHDKEFSIWRFYSYCLHGFEIAYVDALVEIAVI